MDSKAQIEAMARKYKEEMLRMYKQSGRTNAGAAETISPPRNAKPTRSPQASPPQKAAPDIQPMRPTSPAAVSPPKTEQTATSSETLTPSAAEKALTEIPEPKKPAQNMPEQNGSAQNVFEQNGFAQNEHAQNGHKGTSKFPTPEEIMHEEFEESLDNKFKGEIMPQVGSSDEVQSEPSAEMQRPEMASPTENTADEPENFQGNYNSEEFSDLPDPLEPRYSGSEDETPDVSGTGYIKAEVTTGSGAVPIENAVVLITKKENGRTYLLKMLISDESGSTETVALPAPNVAFSETPDPTEKPFANYYISAYANGYYAENDMEVPVFSGVKSIQPVALIPKASDDSSFMMN